MVLTPNRLRSSTFSLLAVLASYLVLRAQTAGQPGTAKALNAAPQTNLSGVWVLHPPAGPGEYSNFAFTKEEPPMTPWAETKYKAAKPIFGANKKPAKDSNDPVYRCFPPGVPRIYLHRRPMEIVQLSDEVIMMFEYARFVRHIHTDGRPHDEFLDPPLWMGDSIGKWEGDTLVVDVIGFNDKTWLDRIGHPHSDALHVVERIRRVDHATLADDITIDDSKAYKKPWTIQSTFDLQPRVEIDWEAVCEDQKLLDRQ
jgi:hypothetical protein